MMGMTMIMVTHDMTIAEKADKIYRMDDGKLYLYKDKQGYYKNTYEAQLRAEQEQNASKAREPWQG